MTPDDISNLLGRKLSTVEQDAFDVYLEVATQNLENLLCMSLDVVPDPPVTDARTFSARENYRTLYVDPFTGTPTVTIDGITQTVTKKQYDNANADWYNIVEFENTMSSDDVVVTATWGLPELPGTLQLLLARMFGVVSKTQSVKVKSKSNEGFSVTYADGSDYDNFVLANASLISQYRLCNPLIIHGQTPHEYYSEYI